MSTQPAFNGNEKRRIVLYSGEDPKGHRGTLFYLNLFWQAITFGRDKGFDMVPVIDGREASQRVLCPPELIEGIKEKRFDGIIAIMVFEQMTAWMREAGIPFSPLIEGNRHSISMDYQGLIANSFKRLAELGCTSVGLIFPSHLMTSEMIEHLDEVAASLSLEVKYEWILSILKEMGVSGYNHFNSLWDLCTRPNGLVIFPDETARGVISAIIERRIQVPKELKLVVHRNAEFPYFVPMPCDWVENSGDAVVRCLFENLEDQWNGKPPSKQSVPFRLVPGYQ